MFACPLQWLVISFVVLLFLLELTFVCAQRGGGGGSRSRSRSSRSRRIGSRSRSSGSARWQYQNSWYGRWWSNSTDTAEVDAPIGGENSGMLNDSSDELSMLQTCLVCLMVAGIVGFVCVALRRERARRMATARELVASHMRASPGRVVGRSEVDPADLFPAAWRVEGTYTGSSSSRLNRGTYKTAFNATLSESDAADRGEHAAAAPPLLTLTGSGRDEAGSFTVEGSVRRDGSRASFAKLYDKFNTVVVYRGQFDGPSRIFRGKWNVQHDRECGTTELTFTQTEGRAAAPALQH